MITDNSISCESTNKLMYIYWEKIVGTAISNCLHT